MLHCWHGVEMYGVRIEGIRIWISSRPVRDCIEIQKISPNRLLSRRWVLLPRGSLARVGHAHFHVLILWFFIAELHVLQESILVELNRMQGLFCGEIALLAELRFAFLMSVVSRKSCGCSSYRRVKDYWVQNPLGDLENCLTTIALIHR
jgi:hypothetical protein